MEASEAGGHLSRLPLAAKAVQQRGRLADSWPEVLGACSTPGRARIQRRLVELLGFGWPLEYTSEVGLDLNAALPGGGVGWAMFSWQDCARLFSGI